ncbi:MAG: hypothetical protein U0822_16850 [Anaerolineae bacterium]
MSRAPLSSLASTMSGLVQAAAQGPDQALDELPQLLVVVEEQVAHETLLPVLDDEDALRAVADDLLDARRVHERLEDAHAQQAIEEMLLDRLGVEEEGRC